MRIQISLCQRLVDGRLKTKFPPASMIIVVVAGLLALSGCATSSPSTQLYVAVRDGSYSDAKRTVDRNTSQLNMCNLLGKSISASRADFVSLALRDGASPNCTDISGFTVLYAAVAQKCAECAKALIAGGARINESGGSGNQTPLDTAYVIGDRNLIQFMLSRGAVRKISDAQVAQTQANIRNAERKIEDEPTSPPPPMQPAPSSIYGAIPDVGGQILSPSSNTQSRTRQPVENMNRCMSIRTVKGQDLVYWEFSNNCPVPVSISWCSQPGCNGGSVAEISAGSKYKTPANGSASAPRVLYCPTDTNNTSSGGVWACWPKK